MSCKVPTYGEKPQRCDGQRRLSEELIEVERTPRCCHRPVTRSHQCSDSEEIGTDLRTQERSVERMSIIRKGGRWDRWKIESGRRPPFIDDKTNPVDDGFVR